ncbi:MAG: LuxR family transcriptional activator of conjugal transfer of Ti plasmids [Afipia broomeae]|jgi:LuxR family transcriptional activator of conjugal transfer of Ti plasmids|uniref:HTH luxR-type domain-containing protein n=1 Tax=Candidatus Afipia apatlaquensis TaxID=2712852 RepID=A0A7C9VS66_9BRAD|nr:MULTISPECIES: autoinducer binding domain-containing protein [Nitrobacteraceae]MBQ8101673.1 autoinducer binding domain-containing protein [Afipia sp.]NGX99271.1 hypothetical protein [Candidatus Afipia apatlaquensis]RTL76549.1 MAG: hypothetical protein EKK35_19880 [Bradyrhizobiaceae bacterium]TXH80111.1 MAG: hypothetical protein E6Q77_11155 [Rhizobium sp.]MCF2523257.1 LuxR family transcriptional regulator [Bradyrhizobium sp. G127]
MKSVEHIFQEFIDAIHTAENEGDFERIAIRVAQRLGFRWFAYLRITDNEPILISSYPKSWTNRYFASRYQQLDPVVRRAALEHDLFTWSGEAAKPLGTRAQRDFFDEATTFGIRSGLTVPIRGGFGRVAAFTLASDDLSRMPDSLIGESKEIFQLLGLYFHSHLTAKLQLRVPVMTPTVTLTQRERQCLMWASRGKTAADIAVLAEITPRTASFHLDNARRKLGAVSIAQCVAEALRQGLLI